MSVALPIVTEPAAGMEESKDNRVAAAAMILRLRRLGIVGRDLLNAIESVPRRLFVPREWQAYAYSDRALPIECGQTISAPAVVGKMVAALEVNARHSVLEIGTGSGYQAAVLAGLGRRVTTIERYRTLVRLAEARWQALGIRNISGIVADGALGWGRQAPFDRIILSVAVAAPPENLLEQLADDGVLIAPVETDNGQRLTVFRRHGEATATRDLGPARFLPAVAGIAQNL